MSEFAELRAALQAWKDAQQATDDAVEHMECAIAEGWYNEPGGTSHVGDSDRRADAAWAKAIALRDAALADQNQSWTAPTLLETKPDSFCSCPEETWEAFGVHLFMHLKAGELSNAHADYGDGGEQEMTVTADTVDLARAAIFGWARALATPAISA